MSVAPRNRMSADAFIAWAMELSGPGRFELVDSEPMAMAPELRVHVVVKARVWRALDDAVRAAGIACEALADGMAVAIDERTVYEPDALVHCGAPLDDNAVTLSDPVIVVEVLSPSSAARDAGAKFADYARLPSLRHYLIVDPEARLVVHHQLEPAAPIRTAILRSGPLDLTPPGITISVEAIFE